MQWISLNILTTVCAKMLHMLLRNLLMMLGSTPVPALRARTGLLGMRWRIWQEKLLLVLAMRKAEGTPANLMLGQ